jgi:transposase
LVVGVKIGSGDVKMLERGKMERGVFELVDTESLVPKGHVLRKIDAAVDFNGLYELVEPLYSEENGRPSVDPVVLVKMVLIQHLYGLPSLRRTAEEVGLNVAYRWFLGYTLQEETPHFSTVSYNFRHRFTAETVEGIFGWILAEVAEAGYLSAKAVFIDGTHIKASANRKKQVQSTVPVLSKRYAKELMEEVNADRETHGKRPFDDDDEPPKPKRDNTSKKKLAQRKKERKATKSTTDPESGLFVKGEHKCEFAYEAHTACDKNGFVLETVVTPGNVHDSVAFDDVYDAVTERFAQVATVVADSAYKTPHICKKVFTDGRVLSTAYKRPQTMKGGHEWWKYVYDEHYDCILCPEYQPLRYCTTNREGYREYKSDPKVCVSCPTRHLCTRSKDCVKTVQRHIWKEYEELADDARYTPEYETLYKRRKETIERVFADAKEKHAMRYTMYRGLAQVTNWVRLKFAAMNLKKLANWRWRDAFLIPTPSPFPSLLRKTRLPLLAVPGFSTD